MDTFLVSFHFSAAKAGNHTAKGWSDSAYGGSKIGVTLLSFAQQREFDKDSREDIVLNAVSLFLAVLKIRVCN